MVNGAKWREPLGLYQQAMAALRQMQADEH